MATAEDAAKIPGSQRPGGRKRRVAIFIAYVTMKEGRKEVCHARDSQNWLIRVKSSALVTGFVLAEGTYQTMSADETKRLLIRPLHFCRDVRRRLDFT